MKQNTVITAKYPGTCANCGDHIDSGDQILWKSRGIVECANCAAITPWSPQPAKANDPYQWDENDDTIKPERVIRDRTGKPTNQWVIKPSKPVQITPSDMERVHETPTTTANFSSTTTTETDPQVQTINDLIVVLVNAACNLTDKQCDQVKLFAENMAEISTSNARKHLFSIVAKGVE